MSESVRLPVAMTVAEFLDWDPGDGRPWQLVDGEPSAMAPATRTHGAIQARLGQLLGNHLDAAGGRCGVVIAPGIIPRVQASHNVRVPNLAVICSPYAVEEATLADPVLIVEILSPSNQAETWANVWTYTSIPSVREILVVRTTRIGAEVLTRLPDGSWPAEPATVTAGDLVLHSIGFRAPLADLYRTTRLAGIAASG
jgi:Uma2 family endonuclease